MPNQKYTPEGLPILTKDTLDMHFVEEEKLDRGSEDSLIKALEGRAEKIFSGNSVFEKAMDRFCNEYDIEGVEELIARAAGDYVYRLLSRQAEVNRLEEE